MKALAITTGGAFIPAAVCAQIRHPLMSDLAEMRRVDGVVVPPEYIEAVQTIDNIGAAFEARRARKGFV